jgi:RNA polymerase sigma-70 factor, ECF subfamily
VEDFFQNFPANSAIPYECIYLFIEVLYFSTFRSAAQQSRNAVKNFFISARLFYLFCLLLAKQDNMHRTSEEFIALLQPHYNSAAQYCRALFQGARDAEDCLQDAIIAAMENVGSLKEEGKFRSWFFTIITRTFYVAKSREIKKGKLFAVLKEKDRDFPAIYQDDFLSAKETVLLEALHSLTEKERAAILLFELGGFSLTEIQQIQGEKSLSAIKSRLSRTREKLRYKILQLEQLNEQGGTYDFKSNAAGF